MSLTQAIRRAREVSVAVVERSPTLRILALVAKPAKSRTTSLVDTDYSRWWSEYNEYLDRSDSLDAWLYIAGFEDTAATHIYRGHLRHGPCNTGRYWIDEVEKTIRERFPEARSITEYGCGVGRNLLALKQRFPAMKCYGYELAAAGVEVARRAAKKFGQDVEYAQLDYVKGGEQEFVHPRTDLALTLFSLEQIPHANAVAVKNMLDHASLGSIHIEPVCENYPLNYPGVLGRLYTKRVDYLQNFDAGVRALALKDVSYRVLDTSHNPLIPNPSIYALQKK